MKIAIDGKALLSEKLTGIGNVCENISLELMKQHPSDEYVYNYFAMRGRAAKRKRMERMCINDNVSFKAFPLFSSRLYKVISTFIPIPYRWFFGKADIAHFYNFIIPPGVKGKKVCTIHDLAFLRHPETVSFLTRKMLALNIKRTIKRADGIAVVSMHTAKDLNELYGVPFESMKVIYPGIDLERFRPIKKAYADPVLEKYGLEYGEYILYLGTIEPRKNLASLIRGYAKTARRLRAEGRPCPKLILAGMLGWYYGEILKTAEKEGISDDVKFLGYIDSADKVALYCGARAFAFPSLYEGFGIPVIEAMACGTPVLTSDSSSLTEIASGVSVMIDLKDSDDSIANGLYSLCTDDELCKKLSDDGIENAKRFTWQRAADETYSYYLDVLRSKKS